MPACSGMPFRGPRGEQGQMKIMEEQSRFAFRMLSQKRLQQRRMQRGSCQHKEQGRFFQGSWEHSALCPRNCMLATLFYIHTSCRDLSASVWVMCVIVLTPVLLIRQGHRGSKGQVINVGSIERCPAVCFFFVLFFKIPMYNNSGSILINLHYISTIAALTSFPFSCI